MCLMPIHFALTYYRLFFSLQRLQYMVLSYSPCIIFDFLCVVRDLGEPLPPQLVLLLKVQ